MSNEKFKVKFGLAVGDTSATIDGTSGDIITAGDLTVNGGQINGPGSGSDLVIQNASTISVVNDFTNFQTDAGVTKAYFNNSGSKFTFNGTDADNTGNYNLYSHGTFGTLGNATIGGTLDVQGGTITDSTGALNITTGASNGNITLDPNGTGSVVMTFANGGNLTNDRNYVSGIIRQPVAAAAGDVWGFGPTGTGNPYRGISIDNSSSSTTTTGKRTGMVMRSFAPNPRNSYIGESARGTNPSSPTQLTINSNLVELIGSGWAGNSDGTGFQATGCTISGTTLTVGTVTSGAPAVGQLISSFTPGILVTTGTTITANISGSGSGSTWTVSNSQTVASSAIWGGGDGWISSVNGVPAGIRLTAAENWTSNSSGTAFQVALSPINNTTAITAGASFNAINMSLNSTNMFSDTYNFVTKPTGAGGTNFTMLNLTQSLATVGGDLRINGNDIQASDGATNISLTSNTLTTLAGNLQVNGGGTSIIKSNEFRINNSSNNYLSSVVDNGTRAQYTWTSPYTPSQLLLDLDATASVFALYLSLIHI